MNEDGRINNHTGSSTEGSTEKKNSMLLYVLIIAVIVAAFLSGRATAGIAAKEMSERMKTALSAGYASGGVDLLYTEISIRENGIKTDYIVPCEGLSQETFEAAFPNYDEYNGTAYIFRNGGLGRKTKFVPGLTDFLNAHPHE